MHIVLKLVHILCPVYLHIESNPQMSQFTVVQCRNTIQLCPLYLVHLNSGSLLHIDPITTRAQQVNPAVLLSKNVLTLVLICVNVLMGPCYTKAKQVRCAYFRPQVNQGWKLFLQRRYKIAYIAATLKFWRRINADAWVEVRWGRWFSEVRLSRGRWG